MRSAFDLTAGWLADAAGGRLVSGDPATIVTGISIDTRTLQQGALYVAIKGERLDGHAFVADAVARGAVGVVVSDGTSVIDGAFVIAAADTLAALQTIGREIRRMSHATVIAITGSARGARRRLRQARSHA